jgi:hypothetical protein
MEKHESMTKEVRELAARFTSGEIEICLNQQLQEGVNECRMGTSTDHVINELSKAEFVRKRMDEGLSPVDAMRELARRIRNVQQGFGGGGESSGGQEGSGAKLK